MINQPPQTVIIKGTVKKETDKAYLLDCEGDEDWFPKSQVVVNSKAGTIVVPTWLLNQKGWVY